MQCMAGIVWRYHDVLASFFLGYDVCLARLLHVYCADQVVFRKQVVIYMFRIDFILASTLLHKDFVLRHLKHSSLHQLTRSLVESSHFRRNLLVVESGERSVGKDFQYLGC